LCFLLSGKNKGSVFNRIFCLEIIASACFNHLINENVNLSDMKTNFTQQEILLITGTSFSEREWSKNDDDGKRKNFTDKDKLEEACWNGLLYEMLPEIFKKSIDGKKLYLWEIKQGASFIDIELGEVPAKKDNYFSIDPYCFLNDKFYN
jgi:hypothetical protein